MVARGQDCLLFELREQVAAVWQEVGDSAGHTPEAQSRAYRGHFEKQAVLAFGPSWLLGPIQPLAQLPTQLSRQGNCPAMPLPSLHTHPPAPPSLLVGSLFLQECWLVLS